MLAHVPDPREFFSARTDGIWLLTGLDGMDVRFGARFTRGAPYGRCCPSEFDPFRTAYVLFHQFTSDCITGTPCPLTTPGLCSIHTSSRFSTVKLCTFPCKQLLDFNSPLGISSSSRFQGRPQYFLKHDTPALIYSGMLTHNAKLTRAVGDKPANRNLG